MFPDIPRPLNTQYRCYSVSMLPGNERQDVERGGKSKLSNWQLIHILSVLNSDIILSRSFMECVTHIHF